MEESSVSEHARPEGNSAVSKTPIGAGALLNRTAPSLGQG